MPTERLEVDSSSPCSLGYFPVRGPCSISFSYHSTVGMRWKKMMSGRPGNRIQFDSDASAGTVTVLFEVGDGTGVHFAGGLIDVEQSQGPAPGGLSGQLGEFQRVGGAVGLRPCQIAVVDDGVRDDPAAQWPGCSAFRTTIVAPLVRPRWTGWSRRRPHRLPRELRAA